MFGRFLEPSITGPPGVYTKIYQDLPFEVRTGGGPCPHRGVSDRGPTRDQEMQLRVVKMAVSALLSVALRGCAPQSKDGPVRTLCDLRMRRGGSDPKRIGPDL